ncbi:MAG TPA: porphobilinogen synthase [Syntrophorhabdus sp.]|jgi:porphobilinogen synthase|nr:porphobilinogen synthase [Syntrophorhabdus sp.]MDI9557592.1 porphobilinogen synthase [Pseudomonadota bacterium]OQB73996.1 MAG: Delta-aminolevulinic acid dehydratase [Deltaproteobacteria bacterium ADurb.Bin135]MBP8745943.1 porphobilinogen synthase [Syntrophorhabdus sp.]NMC95350.1 porphobilinogen synthase [Syntrophorhabdus sp.]
MNYPVYRPRRLRKNEKFRNMIQETELSPNHLIYPVFVKEMAEKKVPIPAMPDVYQFSVEGLPQEIEEVASLSIPAVLLFGIPEKKDEVGSGAYAEDGVVQKAVRVIKKLFGSDIMVITDVCMCEYTNHGHCGVIKDGEVDNDETLKLLARSAHSHVVAGADMVAPSDMMDGRVKAIRETLDISGFCTIPIMSYAAKYASALYGPFREAAESAPQFGDRRGYQMDPPNQREALREIRLDIQEGADIIMVKPALFYLDVLSMAKQEFNIPLAAYSVSGEYTMIKLAASKGYLDYERAVVEANTSIRRAGADIIITYFAKDLAGWYKTL